MTKNLEHKAQAGEYRSNPFATSASFAAPKRESMAQANPTHYQVMVLAQGKPSGNAFLLLLGPQPASPDGVLVHAIWGQEHCTPLLNSAGVLRNSQCSSSLPFSSS